MPFAESLQRGKTGESLIAKWLMSRGNLVLPVYESLEEFKGPRVLSDIGDLVATDMFVFNPKRCLWVEAKHKSAFTLHRKTGRWVTGIDLHHYGDYQRVRSISRIPTFLFFLQQNGTAKDSPDGCPTGLFGGELGYLMRNENHRHQNWGRHGMVYWSSEVLKKYAELDELMPFAA